MPLHVYVLVQRAKRTRRFSVFKLKTDIKLMHDVCIERSKWYMTGLGEILKPTRPAPLQKNSSRPDTSNLNQTIWNEKKRMVQSITNHSSINKWAQPSNQHHIIWQKILVSFVNICKPKDKKTNTIQGKKKRNCRSILSINTSFTFLRLKGGMSCRFSSINEAHHADWREGCLFTYSI